MAPRKKKLDGAYFARLALDYFDHPKIGGLSDAAIVAHLEMIVYSRRYLTDGFIPNRVARRFGSGVLDELANNDPASPSVAINPDGSVILHGYADAQETKEEIEGKRLVNARNGAKGGRPKNPSGKQTETQSVSETKPSRQAEVEGEGEEEISPSERGTLKRATQLPKTWAPTEKHAAIAAERGISLDTEAEKFRDWCGATGRTYKDHHLAFNGWLRRATPDRTQQQRPNRDAASAEALVQAHYDMQAMGGHP